MPNLGSALLKLRNIIRDWERKRWNLAIAIVRKKHIYSVRFGEIRDSVIILDSGSRFGFGHLQISDSNLGFEIRVS